MLGRLRFFTFEKIWQAVLGGLAVFLAYKIALRLPDEFNFAIDFDARFLHFVAWRILGGAAPYRDVFDNNLPGTHLMHMLCLTVFGASERAFYLFSDTLLYISMLGMIVLLWPYSRLLALVTSLLWAGYYLHSFSTANQRDFMMVPFLLWSSIAVIEADKKNWRGVFFLAGMATAFASSIKPTALIFGALETACILLRHGRPSRRELEDAVFFILGGASVLMAILYWLSTTGGLLDFMDVAFHYIPSYRATFIAYPANWSYAYWLTVTGGMAAGMLIACEGLKLGLRRWLILSGFVWAMVHLFIQNKNWGYHYFPPIAWHMLLMATVIASLKKPEWPLHTHIVLLAAVIGLCWLYWPKFITDPRDISLAASHRYATELQNRVGQAALALPLPEREAYMAARAKPVQAIGDFNLNMAPWEAAMRGNWASPLAQNFCVFFEPRFTDPVIRARQKSFYAELARKHPPILVITHTCPDLFGGLHRDRGFNAHYRLFSKYRWYNIYIVKPTDPSP